MDANNTYSNVQHNYHRRYSFKSANESINLKYWTDDDGSLYDAK